MDQFSSTAGRKVGGIAARALSRPQIARPNQRPGTAGPAFRNAFLKKLLNNKYLNGYAQRASNSLNAPKSKENFEELFKALADLSRTEQGNRNLGRRIGEPTKRIIKNVVFPLLGRPAPPPNPVVNGFLNALKSINLSGPVAHFASPEHANNLKIIVESAQELSKNKTINLKREDSVKLGAALGRIIDKILGQIHKNTPTQFTTKGVLIGGFFQGLTSQNKQGTARWLSMFAGNRIIGSRNVSPALKNILLVLLKKNKNANNGRLLVKSVQNFYTKLQLVPPRPGQPPNRPVGNRFINGIVDPDLVYLIKFLANPPPTLATAVKTFRQFKNQTVTGAALTALTDMVKQSPEIALYVAKTLGGILRRTTVKDNGLNKGNGRNHRRVSGGNGFVGRAEDAARSGP